MQLLFLALLAAIGADGCQREHHRHAKKIFKRAETAVAAPELDENQTILLDSFDSTSLSEWSYYYTHGAHLAGTNKTMAQWTVDRWTENGFNARLDEYYVYLNYPFSHSLELCSGGKTFQASLTEAVLAEDDTTSYPNRIPTFHGYSATGNATAEYVYVGRGQQVDFNRLKALGVQLEGKIALAKYGGPFRGLKVKNAQANGMIGAIIFTDPISDQNVTEANGFIPYPNGPARNPTSVQRGSVQFLSSYPGDPTTPDYPSKPGVPRVDPKNTTPRIPSLPVSQLDALPLLQALDGFGTSGKEVNRTGWVGGLNATYSTGPNPGATISMSNVMNDTITNLWDSIGIINGTCSDEVVIVGNHRDAWIIGGAADPNSGSAVMIELSKAFGKLLAKGWKPKRTLVLASWDGEEYGLVGSTEWMEEYIPWLKEAAVSYLNIDVAVSGPIPDLAASPELHDIAIEVSKQITWPYRGTTNRTMYDVWYENSGGAIEVLGSGSDYTSFLHRGIPSIDMGAYNGANDPVYHYHSNYDSYHWMSTYGDPGFVTHKAQGQYLTLLAYRMVTDEFIPFNTTTYVNEMESYLEELKATIATANTTLDVTPIQDAIDAFSDASKDIVSLKDHAIVTKDNHLVNVVNGRLRDFSRGFTSVGGLPGREFYRHVVFAPGLDTGYAPVTFPGVTEAVTSGNFSLAAEWVVKTADGIKAAAGILKAAEEDGSCSCEK